VIVLTGMMQWLRDSMLMDSKWLPREGGRQIKHEASPHLPELDERIGRHLVWKYALLGFSVLSGRRR